MANKILGQNCILSCYDLSTIAQLNTQAQTLVCCVNFIYVYICVCIQSKFTDMVLRVEHAEYFNIPLCFCKADALFSPSFIAKNCDLRKKAQPCRATIYIVQFFIVFQFFLKCILLSTFNKMSAGKKFALWRQRDESLTSWVVDALCMSKTCQQQ